MDIKELDEWTQEPRHFDGRSVFVERGMSVPEIELRDTIVKTQRELMRLVATG